MLANLALFFCFSFFFFGDDGHFGDITKLAIEDTQKKSKERKKEKNHLSPFSIKDFFPKHLCKTFGENLPKTRK